MLFLKSAVLAFSMFSAIPMPRVEWNARSMRYMLAAFPLVGAVIGALFVAAGCGFVALSDVWAKPVPASLAALVLLLLPVLVTGGIHVDGFMDTCDALGSHADREKKLAIMKDPHAGSFAVLGCVLYFVAQYALLRAFADYALGSGGAARRLVNQWQQVQLFLCAASAFVFSRLLSALAVATFPIAKNSGLVRTFSDASARRFTAVWCARGRSARPTRAARKARAQGTARQRRSLSSRFCVVVSWCFLRGVYLVAACLRTPFLTP